MKHINTLREKNAEFLITIEFDYDAMKTEECNDTVNSEELIGTTE